MNILLTLYTVKLYTSYMAKILKASIFDGIPLFVTLLYDNSSANSCSKSMSPWCDAFKEVYTFARAMFIFIAQMSWDNIQRI